MATEFNSPEIAATYAERVVAEELSLRPVILDLIGDIEGKQVLDSGCGDGRYSTELAERGGLVTAMDASRYQLDIALRERSHENVHYVIGSSDNLPIPDASQDIVFMNMVLPDLKDAEMLHKSMQEVRRVLKKNGTFVFSTLHPLYLSPDQDVSDKATGFKKEDYFKEGSSYDAHALTSKGNTMKFSETHFSLTHLSNVLHNTGFVITRLAESRQIPEHGMYLPKYLVFECKLEYNIEQRPTRSE